MASREIESFVLKFKNLQYAGIKASLTLEAENGEAFVTLKANLGCLPPPSWHREHDQGLRRPVHRSPSYFRRQERRKAATAAAEEETIPAEKAKAPENIDAQPEIFEVAEEATNDKGKKDTNDDDTSKQFECLLSDFHSNWENGLKVHMSRMHSRIDQLDGHTDNCFNDEKYAGSNHYWMKVWLGGAYQSYIDAYDTIEECDLSEDEKNVEKEKLLNARKTALGGSYEHFPPWDMR